MLKYLCVRTLSKAIGGTDLKGANFECMFESERCKKKYCIDPVEYVLSAEKSLLSS